VLVELGQIALVRGDEACQTMAHAVCCPPLPATTREAAAKLRRYRLGLPNPTPSETSDDFETALQIALSEVVEQQSDIRVRVLEATIQKFAGELSDLVDVLRAFG
jgi:hypothetical protein